MVDWILEHLVAVWLILMTAFIVVVLVLSQLWARRNRKHRDGYY